LIDLVVFGRAAGIRCGETTTPNLEQKPLAANAGEASIARESMAEGMDKVTKIAEQIKDVAVFDKTMVWNTDLMEALELDNLVGQAMVTMASAENRKESRGAHSKSTTAPSMIIRCQTVLITLSRKSEFINSNLYTSNEKPLLKWLFLYLDLDQ